MSNVAFNHMPSDIRTPLFFAEINAGGVTYSSKSRQVLIGHKTSGGIASGLVNIGGEKLDKLFGWGSMLADMAAYARRHDPIGEIYALVIDEPTGNQATGTVTFGAAATAAGTINIYIAGEKVEVTVAAGATPTEQGDALVTAIGKGYTKFNRRMAFPVTAVNDAGEVTLTARHKGTSGNAISLAKDLENDTLPAGVTVTLSGATLSSGTGDVDMAASLALLGDASAEWITAPFASTDQLNAVRSFLASSGTGRWAPTVQKHGHYITALQDTLSNLTTFGAGRNDEHVTIIGTRGLTHAPWVIAAAANGIVGRSKNLGASLTEAVEISRPLQTLVLEGIRAPKAVADAWTQADRQSLYSNGIAAYVVGDDGQLRLDRMVTTYQQNAFGTPDTTFLDIETMAQAAYVSRFFRQRIETLYPRHVLRDRNPGNTPGVVTPAQAKRALIHGYQELSQANVVEKPDLFAKYVVVERSGDPNRLNAYLPVDVANQLRVFAANITIYPELTDALVQG